MLGSERERDGSFLIKLRSIAQKALKSTAQPLVQHRSGSLDRDIFDRLGSSADQLPVGE